MAEEMRGCQVVQVINTEKMWKLQVPPKLRNFWWRGLHEFLLVRKILHRKHIEPTTFYELCGADRESIKHVFTECMVARLFWSE